MQTHAHKERLYWKWNLHDSCILRIKLKWGIRFNGNAEKRGKSICNLFPNAHLLHTLKSRKKVHSIRIAIFGVNGFRMDLDMQHILSILIRITINRVVYVLKSRTFKRRFSFLLFVGKGFAEPRMVFTPFSLIDFWWVLPCCPRLFLNFNWERKKLNTKPVWIVKKLVKKCHSKSKNNKHSTIQSQIDTSIKHFELYSKCHEDLSWLIESI